MGQSNGLKLNIKYDKYLQSIAEGNIDSLKQLYDEVHRQIYFFALSILNDEEDAKDVMQETFVKIKFGAGQYRPGTNPKAWIFRIARNLSIDMVRMRKNN